MEKSSRFLFFVLLAGLLLLLGLVFLPFLVDYILLPVAMVAWLLLRIFVLSIDQQVYWWLLIALSVVLAVLRLFQRPVTFSGDRPPDSNPTLKHVHNWRTTILFSQRESGERPAFRRDLVELLTTMYSSRREDSTHFETEIALRERQIPLPEPIRLFLFPDPPAPPAHFFEHPIQFLQETGRSVRQAPERWIRRWSGREEVEYYQAIDQALTLMETTLEMTHDREPS